MPQLPLEVHSGLDLLNYCCNPAPLLITPVFGSSGSNLLFFEPETVIGRPMSEKVFSFHYTLTNPAGEVLDSSDGRDPLVFMAGKGQIIPGLESELILLNVGDKKKVEVKAVDAYGEHDPARTIEVPLDKLPKENIEVGDQFHAGAEHASFVVTSVTETHAKLDGNHPLAGVDLTFDIEVTGIRDATLEELAHGHAHGPGGHGH